MASNVIGVPRSMIPGTLTLQKVQQLDQDSSKTEERAQIREFLAVQIAQRIFDQQIGCSDDITANILPTILHAFSVDFEPQNLEGINKQILKLFHRYIDNIKPLFLPKYTAMILQHTDRTDLLYMRVYDKDILEIESAIAGINIGGATSLTAEPIFIKSFIQFIKECNEITKTPISKKHTIQSEGKKASLKSHTSTSSSSRSSATQEPLNRTLQSLSLDGAVKPLQEVSDRQEVVKLELAKQLDLNPKRAGVRARYRQFLASKIAKRVLEQRMLFLLDSPEIIDLFFIDMPQNLESIKEQVRKKIICFIKESHPLVLSKMISGILENTPRTDILCMRAHDKDTLTIENTIARIDSELPKLMVGETQEHQQNLIQKINELLKTFTKEGGYRNFQGQESSSSSSSSSSLSSPSPALQSTSSLGQLPDASRLAPMASSSLTEAFSSKKSSEKDKPQE